MSSQFKGRREDRRLLTGTGCFTADWNLPGQVHAAFLRSDRAHARIRSIDTSAARALPGVLAVLTGDDVKAAGYRSLPSNAPGPGYKDSTFRPPERHGLAQDRVRFVGEAVALAVAETAAIAQDACELIKVEYEDLQVMIEGNIHRSVAPSCGWSLSMPACWRSCAMPAWPIGSGAIECSSTPARRLSVIRRCSRQQDRRRRRKRLADPRRVQL